MSKTNELLKSVEYRRNGKYTEALRKATELNSASAVSRNIDANVLFMLMATAVIVMLLGLNLKLFFTMKGYAMEGQKAVRKLDIVNGNMTKMNEDLINANQKILRTDARLSSLERQLDNQALYVKLLDDKSNRAFTRINELNIELEYIKGEESHQSTVHGQQSTDLNQQNTINGG